MEEGVDVVALARDALSRDRLDKLALLISDYPLETWFGMPSDEFHIMLRSLQGSTVRLSPIIALMMRGFTALGDSSDVTSAPSTGIDVPTKEGFSFVRAGKARLAGDPVTAFQMMRGLRLVTEAVPRLIDPTRGQRAFVLLQSAISGMLAGRFVEALTLFEKASSGPIPGPLGFFRRDAHLRSAMIHALYGDDATARRHLEHASRESRTRSWVEEHLDADERLVLALLAPEGDTRSAFDDIATLPMSMMGEMWPFYLDGIYRLALRMGNRVEGRTRVKQLAATGLTTSPGTGYAGSIVGMILATDALLSGTPGLVRAELDGIDQRFWLVRLLNALHPSSTPAKSIRTARSLASQTRGLDEAEDLRLTVLAVAHSARGDVPSAADAAAARRGRRDSVSDSLLTVLAPDLMTTSGLATADDPVNRLESATPRLTPRELDVLTLVAEGLGRSEIAERLYLSVDTVKSHQRTLYRKLDVNRASAAILEARRLGLV
ncbi:LuxR C-terminal-related transcriptional regulator [Agromyces atrinae]|uniref:DNA-binding CsgD family transcriptional regulator n=1 Tax=Agromyces atrinae TaxID=592376 RepID=A0A4Q2MGP4_9MICO|nr:LuxR C-terminal-related transcriptional regulator [Agromyces atrinae]NYD67445.1 DNA-binding CsgD family transcriptional regulator [Agromyces atrinae]RXZ88330.1 response regulator transcription factor [Agromyces atrinae]